MKIENKGNLNCCFEEVELGSVFKKADRIYMKIRPIISEIMPEYNAIDLNETTVVRFGETEKVEFVDATLIIK